VRAAPLVCGLLALAALCPTLAAAGPADRAPDDAVSRSERHPLDGEAPPLDPERFEYAALPGLAFDSDRGVGLGLMGILALFEPGYDPYRFRIETLVFLTVKARPEGGAEVPFQLHYVRFDFPDVAGRWLRLSGELAYRQFSTTGYYGVGNHASGELPPDLPSGLGARFFQYNHIYPTAELFARSEVAPDFVLFAGPKLQYNVIHQYGGSLLGRDLAGDSGPTTQRLLVGTRPHFLLAGVIGASWDSRNHEYAPSRGAFHEVSVQAGGGFGERFTFGRANLTLRWYAPLLDPHLVFAARAMVDLLMGEPPFYELARTGGLKPMSAPGGSEGIRGVPSQRYHGKVKAMTNLELRAKLWDFAVGDQRFNVGAAAFVDAGRVWTDYVPHPELDGVGLGLKYGAGGGLRLQWGETFVARVDAAWSPDGVGFYAEGGHSF
jgi:hypothetical protein